MTVKRVVIITDLSEAVGGQEVLALASARLLKERGVEVIYVCGDRGDSLELRALDVEVCASGQRRLLELPRGKAFRHGLYNSQAKTFMDRVVHTYASPDTVFHLHGWAQIFSPSIFKVLSPVAQQTFLHAHDMSLACPNGVFMDFPRSEVCTRTPLSMGCLITQCDKRNYAQKIWRAARHSVLARCLDRSAPWAGIVIGHPGMKPMLRRFGYPEPLFRLVRNPVRPYLNDRVHAEENESFLFVGRLEEEKGVIELAQASARVGVPLVCIGEGSLEEPLARDFPNVVLTGKLRGHEIGNWAAKSRALVFPTRLPEPFGLVLAEAIHSGLPAAVSNTALMAAEIESGGLGLSFDLTDKESFDAVLSEFRDMPPARLKEMSQRGHACAVDIGLSEDEWVDGLVALYDEALTRTGRPG